MNNSTSIDATTALHVRWLGSVPYSEGWDLQTALFDGEFNHLLLCEHRPVFTMGRRTDEANLLITPAEVGAELHRVNRGGDVTFHGPGQLVGYPILSLPGKRNGGMADTVAYVTSIEQLLIDVVGELGIKAGRIDRSPGIWVDPLGSRPRKLAAIGVRLTRGRTMHGFALNVDLDLDWFKHIVPCGISDKGVTSLRAEGSDATMRDVVELVATHGPTLLAPDRPIIRQDMAHKVSADDLAPFSRGAGPGERPGRSGVTGVETKGVPVRLRGRLEQAGVTDDRPLNERKPPWMRVKLRTEPKYLELKKLSRQSELTTVCEEAGCPNIFDCWNEGTATFMLLGDRCTRACGFCLVDTSRPLAVDHGEPERLAQAVAELGLTYVVLTMVARDDLDDGGAEIVARSVEAINATNPGVGVEVLISDLKGDAEALMRVCKSGPAIVNHNMETVARLQRAVRPSASYARSLALLARAKAAGMTTKSGLIVGMGERPDEVRATLADLAAVGTDMVTVGQYLRPTSNHLPLQRWWEPSEFEELKRYGEEELGLALVQASPLTRSSHHAGSAAASVINKT